MDFETKDIWIAAGMLLGFQVGSPAARINSELVSLKY
jgi:hypothetical protein